MTSIKKRCFYGLTVIIAASLSFLAGAQEIAVKTNLLYDATSTLNLGMEFGLSDKWTLDVSGNYNPWEFGKDRKIKHWLIQPEVRYWLREKFNHHFFGIHLHGGEFNWSGILLPAAYQYQGWLAGGGVSYGYQWKLNNRWNLEASLGIGYTYLQYDKYPCGDCGKKIKSAHRNYFGPTKAAISIIYILK